MKERTVSEEHHKQTKKEYEHTLHTHRRGTLFSLDFRRHVRWGPTTCSCCHQCLRFGLWDWLIVSVATQIKIRQLDVSIVIHQRVAQLQISMN